jgi:hypothetical protein
MKEPPANLDSAQVLLYAETGGAENYTGRLTVSTGRKVLRELKPVQRLAIVKEFASDGILLMHCTMSWKVLAVTGAASVEAARQLGEHAYRGISWVPYRKLSLAEARALERDRRRVRKLSEKFPFPTKGEHAA